MASVCIYCYDWTHGRTPGQVFSDRAAVYKATVNRSSLDYYQRPPVCVCVCVFCSVAYRCMVEQITQTNSDCHITSSVLLCSECQHPCRSHSGQTAHNVAETDLSPTLRAVQFFFLTSCIKRKKPTDMARTPTEFKKKDSSASKISVQSRRPIWQLGRKL